MFSLPKASKHRSRLTPLGGQESSLHEPPQAERRSEEKKIFRPLSIPEQKIQRGSETDEIRDGQEDESREPEVDLDFRP